MGRGGLVLLLLAAALVSLFTSAAGFKVGVSVVNVTPSDEEIATGRIFLGGYGALGFRDGQGYLQPAEGVHDPIWSRAFVVEDDAGVVAATVVIDAVGISNRIMNEIRAGVEQTTGIPRDNLFISATHTHCGLDLQGLWGFVTDSYRSLFINETISSVAEAFASRRAAVLSVAETVGYARNRRDWGYTDTAMTLLDAADASTGERIATVVNFGAHPVTLDSDVLVVSSDYPHYLRSHMESELGAPVVFVNGVDGDVSPVMISAKNFERCEEYGVSLAEIALDAFRNGSFVAVQGTSQSVATTHYTQQCTNPAFIGALLIDILDYDYEGSPEEGFTFESQVSYWQLGDTLGVITFPGESLTRNGLPVRDALPQPFGMFYGLTGDTLGYFVPTDEWESGRNGGYEESVSTDMYAGDATQEIAIDLITSKHK